MARRILAMSICSMSIWAMAAGAPPMAAVSYLSQNAADTPEGPITWSVRGDKTAEAAKPGVVFGALVTAKIEEGWHLYSLDEESGGPRPTVIAVPKGQPFEISGDIDSPVPRTAMDDNFGVKTDFYEGSATFTVPVRISPESSPGRKKVLIEVRYQSCSKQLCLPPKTVKLELAVEVQPAR